MGAIPRVVMVALIFQTVTFLSLWFYARAKRRDALEQEWPQKDRDVSVQDFVAAGLKAQEKPLKRTLIWAVYVAPTALIVLYIYLTSSE